MENTDEGLGALFRDPTLEELRRVNEALVEDVNTSPRRSRGYTKRTSVSRNARGTS